jgi:hypothetical protein
MSAGVERFAGAAQRRAPDEEDTGAGRWSIRHVSAALACALALALTVAVLVTSSGNSAQPSALSTWADDHTEVVKMQDTINSLTHTLDATKRELRRAALAAKDGALRDVYQHPEQYDSKRALSVQGKLSRMASLLKAPSAAPASDEEDASALAAAADAKSPPKGVPLVGLRMVDSLTAALKVLEDSKLTPAPLRKLATLTMTAVKAQLQALESGVDCSKKDKYDELLANFGNLLSQLHTDDKSRKQMDAEKKATMDKAVAEFQKVQKAYNDSTARLAEAEAHGKEAHDGFVKYKAAVDELQKEEATLESRLTTVDADSAKTLSELSVLKNYIDEMQHAIDTGAQDTYSARLMSAMNTVDRLITSDQNKDALRTALGSPAKPKELTADILQTIEAEAKGGAKGLKDRIAKVKEALANATQLYKGYQMDYVTFSTDADLQRELQRAAHAELAKLDGEQMAATWAYEAWKMEYNTSSANSDEVVSATQTVIAKLAVGIESCGKGAAASSPFSFLQSTAVQIRKVGKEALRHESPSNARQTVMPGNKPRALGLSLSPLPPLPSLPPSIKAATRQKLAGDPVLYKEPEDLNDKSVVEDIAAGKSPALGEKAPDKLDSSQMNEFKQAAAEADEEHKLDDFGLGKPKQPQWISSGVDAWARKKPGATVMHKPHLSGLDKQKLAMRPLSMREIKAFGKIGKLAP